MSHVALVSLEVTRTEKTLSNTKTTVYLIVNCQINYQNNDYDIMIPYTNTKIMV